MRIRLALLSVLVISPFSVFADCDTVQNCAQQAVEAAQESSETVISMRSLLPTGAVIAFDLNTCPSGWSEYRQAYGRFIRGIDKGVTKTDPKGLRTPGDLQDDELKKHVHGGLPIKYRGTSGGTYRTKYDQDRNSKPTGGAETRPKNVALLYCRRD